MKQDDFSFLGNIDIEIVEALYSDYRKDPKLVEESWQQFFKGFDLVIFLLVVKPSRTD